MAARPTPSRAFRIARWREPATVCRKRRTGRIVTESLSGLASAGGSQAKTLDWGPC
jgi:hypothetical protein